MTVIIFEGLPRTGKTLGMTWYALSKYVRGYETFSNYTLKFPFQRYKKMDVYEMLQIPFDDVDRNPKQLLIQEADKIFDSWIRNDEMRMASSLFGQSGKRNLDIIGDTQYFSRLAKSLRMIVEYVVHCAVYEDKTGKPLVFEHTWCIPDEHFELVPIMKPILYPAEMLKPIYNMYDSYETTMPFITGDKEG